MSDCLGLNDFEELRSAELGDDQRRRIETHLRACTSCQARFDEFLDDERFLAGAMPLPGNTPSEGETEAVGQAERRTAREHLPRIEGYRLLRWLGAGGMAVVYEAVQEKLNRRVALKLLPAVAGSAQPSMVERFRREATAAAGLHHTNIIPIYDFGESRDGYFYAMELIRGQTVRTLIKRLSARNAPDLSAAELAALVREEESSADGAESPAAGSDSGSSSTGGVSSTGRGRLYYRQAAQWMADAAEALHYAHTCGVIHRDVKPANLILSTDGRIMVADFGLAKTVGDESVTVSGSLLGTYRYMSPEQVGAKRVRVDARTDVYSLGATLYELLALRPAFPSTDREELLGQILFKEPPPPRKLVPTVPAELQTICLKAMEKSPDARYATARALAQDLRRFTSDLPIVARPVGPVGRAVKFVRRHRAGTATAAVIALAIASAVWVRQHERRKSIEAESRQRVERGKRLDALLEKGAAQLNNGELVGADQVFREVLELEPGNVRALFNRLAAKKGLFSSTGDERYLVEADELLASALTLDPFNYRVLDAKGVILRNRGRLDDAAGAHLKVIDQEPSYYPAWVNLGTVLAFKGHLDEAEERLRKGVELSESQKEKGPMPWRNLGAVQLQLRMPEAAATLAAALERAKGDVTTLLLLAKLHLTLEPYRDAKKALEYAITAKMQSGANPPGARVLRMVAWAHLRSEHWSDAIEAAAPVAEQDEFAAFPRLILAIAEARRGNASEARANLAAAREAWPRSLEAKGFLVAADRDKSVLWFDSADDLKELRREAESLLAKEP